MNKNQMAVDVFNNIYDTLPTIPYSNEWSNGTGYYNHAVAGEHAPKLAIGECVASVSPVSENMRLSKRRIVMIGAEEGNIVVFERYSGSENGEFAVNCPLHVEKNLFDGSMRVTGEKMRKFFNLANKGKAMSTITKEVNNAIEQMDQGFAQLKLMQEERNLALRLLALNWVAQEIAIAKAGENGEDVKTLDRVRGAILDKLFEFRLSVPKEGDIGIPKGVAPVQIADMWVSKTIRRQDGTAVSSNLDNKVLFKILELFNQGH